MRLLFNSILLLAFLAVGCVRQADSTHPKDNIVPIDSISAVTNNSHRDSVSHDSTLTMAKDSQESIVLADSAKISITILQIAETILFSINQDQKSSIEFDPGWSSMSGKAILSRAYSDQILKRIGVIFIEHKVPVIISKKSHYPMFVEAEYPKIKFIIYNGDKTIETEYITVGDEQGFYTITYSDTFLELFDLLYTKAMKLYELCK